MSVSVRVGSMGGCWRSSDVSCIFMRNVCRGSGSSFGVSLLGALLRVLDIEWSGLE